MAERPSTSFELDGATSKLTRATPPSTPTKHEDALRTPPRSDTSSHESSTSKRRRLISFDRDDWIGSARKLNYESMTEGSVDDEEEDWQYEEARRRTVKKLWEVNYGDEDDRLIQTTGFCQLYEFVTWFDVVKSEMLSRPPWISSKKDDDDKEEKVEGKWKYRGKGQVKFVQTLEEGYNCGMIRMEMIRAGTLNTLMCHELLEESVSDVVFVSMRCPIGVVFSTP